MKISYNWLQSYFKKELPSPEIIADGLIFHSFEVEAVEKIGNDTLFDIKILPDRAHDCLCHVGVAREVGAIFELEKPILPNKELGNAGIKTSNISISIEEPKLCRRYVGRVVRNIQVKESSNEIKERLQTIGQRSINNIVDSANYVMFEIGQPLHAFDLDKIKGNIVVRNAKKGEIIVTLDDKEIALSEENLVIADDDGPLAIAGVKGGKRAGVTTETKNLLLESANFDPVSIRRTASKLNLHTDASKRYENDFPEVLAEQSIRIFSEMISSGINNKDLIFEDIIDVFPTKRKFDDIIFTVDEISSILGIKLTAEQIIAILERLSIDAEESSDKAIKASVPVWRLDLSKREDLAEEVGRIYGYEKIPNLLPEKKLISSQNKEYLISGKIKEILFDLKFSEIMGYSFENNGEVEVLNPLASDKGFLRKNIHEQFEKKFELNLRNAIFSEEPIKIFEIGNVFSKDGESTRLCIGIGFKTKKLNKSKAMMDEILDSLFSDLLVKEKVEPIIFIEKDTHTVLEFDFNKLVNLSLITDFNFEKLLNKSVNYRRISEFPRVIRDIALFVQPETDVLDVSKIITENSGPLLFGEPILFDVFDKKDESGIITKRSLAFRMIYQSYERTLSDEEINDIILNVISKLEEKGWEVRK